MKLAFVFYSMGRNLLFFLFIGCFPAIAQISPEKLINGAVDRGKWQKVERSIRKAMAKDSLSPEPHYLLALYYFSQANPTANLDSAYRYSRSAWSTFRRADDHDRDRLRKVPLDSLLLLQLTRKIDSAAFDRAKQINTETAYQQFIRSHPAAQQVHSAIELRDEVAFLEAMKLNTWTSFEKFMERYPDSHRRSEAKTRYEKLLYDDKTRDQRQASYIKFVKDYPESPYRNKAINIIFELSTASGAPESFRWFIDNYPSSAGATRARNILYRLPPNGHENTFDAAWMSDSLRNIESRNKSYWVPVYKDALYGFIDEYGTEMISPAFESIAEDYRCGDIHDRLLVTSEGLLARDGTTMWKGKVTDARDLGAGYVLVSTDSGNHVMHESGFRIGPASLQGAQIIASQFVGLRKGNKWAVFSLAGKMLVPFSFDDIAVDDALIVMTKEGKKVLTTPGQLGKISDKQDNKNEFVCDDVRRWGKQQYWIRNGVLEGVVDDDLHYVVPLDRQILKKSSFGFLRGKQDVFYINGISNLEEKPYRSVFEQGDWVRLQSPDGRSYLYDRARGKLLPGDSIWFQGQLAFMQSGDSVKAFLPSGHRLSFAKSSPFQFKEYRDSSAWIVLEEKKKKSVYDAGSGLKLFTMEFDHIEAVSADIFLVTKLGKKGLITVEGRIMLPLEYDAIVMTDPGSFSLLKDKKFGWFDAVSRLLIKPVFERNIKSYNNKLRMAFKGQGYGFVLPDGKPLGDFDWEDIQYWNDSVALVKKDFSWRLFEIRTQKMRLDRIRNFRIVKDSPDEKMYVFQQDNAFGVLSSRKGTIVPIQYSDIVNLGSPDAPLYFAERHIEEAAISVVIYYDRKGKIIRKQAMEAEEFEKIYCDN